MKATPSSCPTCRAGITQIEFGSINVWRRSLAPLTGAEPRHHTGKPNNEEILMTEAGQPLIQIQDLTKVFYTDEIETHALSGVHLSVNKGEYVAMSGPSGCGKSTLLSIIGLLDTPTAGRYQLNSKPVENLD